MTNSIAATATVGMFVAVTGFSWLQVRRIHNTRNVNGISLTTTALTWAASPLWIAYGLIVGDLRTALTSGGAFIATNIIAGALWHYRRDERTRIATTFAATFAAVAALVAVGILINPNILPAASTSVVAFMLWSQAATALAGANLSGVSVGAFSTRALFGGTGWLAHATVTGDLWFVALTLAATPPAAIVAYRAWKYQNPGARIIPTLPTTLRPRFA
jgi:uncharacterized protein with PQ loop repeat